MVMTGDCIADGKKTARRNGSTSHTLGH